MSTDHYENPLVRRYASAEMSQIWSPRRRIETWRQLWILLAESQRELGLSISEGQLEAMRAAASTIDWDRAAAYEREFRHDVMAHVHTFGDLCPTAKPILHWGATSCFVTDNADLMLIREALQLVLRRMVRVVDGWAEFAVRHRDLPCLAFTHFQPAQPTTVGKRACLWAYDICLDVEEVERRLSHLCARSVQGTTGTQASFLKLFDGDRDRVCRLEARVAERMGFPGTYPVTGQTYPRKIDSQILETLSGIAQSAHKMTTDLRLLAGRKEVDEPFEAAQVGSSAMAYKRNPMRSERVCALARFVMSLSAAAAQTAATQWLERTLDDSAVRRLILPQAFLAVDSILLLLDNIARGLIVYPKVIARALAEELPFLATENILMAAVDQGADRQQVHEVIRQHSQLAAREVKQEGRANPLLHLLRQEPLLQGIDIDALLDVRQFIGRAPEQVDDFIREQVEPLRTRYPEALEMAGEIHV